MYYIKYTDMKLLYCSVCKADILHDVGYLLHQKEKGGEYVKVIRVHKCIHCDKVLDSEKHNITVDYKEM